MDKPAFSSFHFSYVTTLLVYYGWVWLNITAIILKNNITIFSEIG